MKRFMTNDELADYGDYLYDQRKDDKAERHSERRRLEERAWARTCDDYRSDLDGQRKVLRLVNGATTLVPLSSLTVEQLAAIGSTR